MIKSNKSRKIALTPGKLYYSPEGNIFIYIKDVSDWYKDKNRLHTNYYQFLEISTGIRCVFGPITAEYRMKELV